MKPVPVHFAALALLVAVASSPHSGDCTTLREISFDQLCTMADFVFSGTVTSASVSKIADGPIVTEYTFERLRFAKGSPSGERVALRVMGGALPGDGMHYEVHGMPELKIGSRYILFCDRDLGSAANSYLPILGLYQGVLLVPDTQGVVGGCVTDALGRNVVDISEGRLVVEARREAPAPVTTAMEAFTYRDTEHTALSSADSIARALVSETIRQQRANLEAERARRRALPRSAQDSMPGQGGRTGATTVISETPERPSIIVQTYSGRPCLTEESVLQSVVRSR